MGTNELKKITMRKNINSCCADYSNQGRTKNFLYRQNEPNEPTKKASLSFVLLKGIDRPFGRGVESILIRSLLVNWRLGYFLNLILKALLHKTSKKPLDAAS
jgi:hypothetical protein